MRRLFSPLSEPAAAPAPSGRWTSGALALLAGVAHTAAFAPVEAWWLQTLALAALVALAAAAAPVRAAWLGWCFGLGWLVSGLWWLHISMHQYGGMPWPLAALAVAVLCGALALYPALALAAWARWRSTGGARPGLDAALLAACWLAAELARASWFTGFPWIASGYAHTTGPLAAWAPWVGVYGIGALSAAAAATLGLWVRSGSGGARGRGTPSGGLVRPSGRSRLAGAGVLLAVLLLPWLAGAGWSQGFSQGTGRLRVSLVQPNVPQDLKFDPARLTTNLEQLARAVETATGPLVVTPESVVPLPFDQVDPAYWQRLQAAAAAPGRAVLVGCSWAMRRRASSIRWWGCRPRPTRWPGASTAMASSTCCPSASSSRRASTGLCGP